MSANGLGALRPIYLHFLDRELGQSVGFVLTPDLLHRVLKCLLLGSDVPLYSGISLIWENSGLSDESRSIIATMSQGHALELVSYNNSIDEFIEARNRLYRHDQDRYPLYFGSALDQLRSIRPTLYKPEDTTGSLLVGLVDWASSGSRSTDDPDQVARGEVSESLRRRETEALTFSFFAPFVARRQSALVAGTVRRRISTLYASHYLSFADGDIATGITGLEYYDSVLSRGFPVTDVQLLNWLLDAVGFGDMVATRWADQQGQWEALLQVRGSSTHLRVVRELRTVLQVLGDACGAADRAVPHFTVRHRVMAWLRSYLEPVRSYGHTSGIEARLNVAELALITVTARMRRMPALRKAFESVTIPEGGLTCDVLLVTATEVETLAVLDVFEEEYGSQLLRLFVENKTYLDLGNVGGGKVLLVQSEMGSGGPGGSLLTVHESIASLRPSAVIMVGIAFGADPVKQRIGEVLISKQMLAYEPQRLGMDAAGSKVTLRGDRVGSSSRLLDRCRSAALDWKVARVRFGLMLSGEKLVDDANVRDALIATTGGEAIGGEMEGTGLYAAAQRHKVDWIVVKAIADWADGNKGLHQKQRQRRAALNAARFAAHLLGLGGVSV